MARYPSKHPTELELLILKILWRDGPATVRAVRDALADQRDLACTSVTTIMNIMIDKGYLKRTKQDGSYVYRPRVSEQVTTRRMLGDLVDRAFDGSAMKVVLNLLETSDIDAEELKRLHTLAVVQPIASAVPEGVDELTSKSIIDENVYILGHVRQPGVYELPEGQELTLTKLIDTAGGYNGKDIEHASVMLLRYRVDGKRHIERKLGLKTLSEDKGTDVFLRNGDFVTLSSGPLYRPQHSVRLVVGKDRMTFQGRDATWDNLPAMLQAVPDRPYTVLCIAMAEDNVPTAAQFNAALRKADEIVDEYGFEERGFSGSRPLGDQAACTQYIPIEWMHYPLGEAIPVDDSLLLTHTPDPPGRPQHAVRLVIGSDRMTFQGQDVNWQQLHNMLKTVPDRDLTIFEIAIASDSPPGDKFHDAEAQAGELQQRFGFERMKQIRSQPLGSIGSLTRYIAGVDTKRSSQHTVHICVSEDGLSFEGKPTHWSELPSLLGKVPDRQNTAMQLSIMPPDLPATTFMDALDRVKQLADQFGFAQFNDVDVSP